MFQAIVAFALLVVAQGGLIASPHGAISSQSIVLGHPAPVARAYAAPAYAAPAYGYGLGKVSLCRSWSIGASYHALESACVLLAESSQDIY